ncbi:RNA polymerase sigma factor SigJ [Ilumatobacter sp.]|uniref:RNA polymerase sigma factor SigJ n=1 Tax=Ilumatobacter sp. TaxID=1967498 RepID=UPI003B52F4F5
MSGTPAIDPAAQAVFDEHRRRLTALAYRMTATPDDADDVVQDAWLRWQGTDRSTIENPAGWLTTVTTRIAIDRLTSARARRESYVGPWLPEPLGGVEDPSGDPALEVASSESLSIGFLRVLETLAPVERAVFLLHDVFGFPFVDIAATVERSPAATRQIASRARARVRDGRPRLDPRPDDVEELTAAFTAAVAEGDLDRLTRLLTHDVVHVSDGGADHHAARRPVVGVDKVSRLLVNLARRNLRSTDRVERIDVNGQHGVYVVRDDRPLLLVVLGWRRGRVAEVLAIVDPAKLRALHAGRR